MAIADPPQFPLVILIVGPFKKNSTYDSRQLEARQIHMHGCARLILKYHLSLSCSAIELVKQFELRTAIKSMIFHILLLASCIITLGRI